MARVGRDDNVFLFGYVKFEMLINYSVENQSKGTYR